MLIINKIVFNFYIYFQAELMSKQVELENMYEEAKREKDQLLEQNRRVS
jgi:hypothetical protein